ncbi:MAG: hypothetical protein Q7R64_00420 [bacterium]|nr:hypothetical protein [bacterium]
MKTPTMRFHICFFAQQQKADILSGDRDLTEMTVYLDGQSLWRDDGDGGYLELKPLEKGTVLALTFPFGKLEGVITEIRKEHWMFFQGEWSDIVFPGEKPSENVCLVLSGIWKGSKNGLLSIDGMESCVSIQPVDGELAKERERKLDAEIEGCFLHKTST